MFFLLGPPPAGNSDLVAIWPILATILAHLDEIQAPAENTKTPFPDARGTFVENKRYHAIRDGFAHFLGKDFFWVGPPPAGNSN